MVASIGKIASPAQGVGYFERDGYYAKDDAAHKDASAWAGRGAAVLGLSGPVDPECFRSVLEGEVPGGRRLGRKEPDGSISHRPGRDVTLSASKSVSLMALVGGDKRIVEAHDRAVAKTLGWIRKNAVKTRMRDPATRAMVRAGGQKMVAACFRHDTSRNLDPQLHTHAVIATMVQGEDSKWRTMVDDGLFKSKMAIGAIYRAELTAGLGDLGYGIERTHPDGRFEIAGVPREVIDACSTRRAEIEAAMAERGMGESKDRGISIQGYAGTGKTTMLKRLRVLAASQSYRTVGLAPSASAAKTLQNESGIESEALQRYLARHDGVAHGRGTAAGLRKLRGANAKTILVVDESSLASSEQVRNLMRIATALGLPRVVLVGDEKQLGAVEAGKPFAQIKAAGMTTAVMDDIVRRRDAKLKAAVKASLTGDVKTAFANLGDNIRQVEYGDLGVETARRWLNLPREQRAATGVIAPTRALRDEINAAIRKGLLAEGAISGPAMQGEKLVPRGLTRAEMARASSYSVGDTVIFTRQYKTLGVEKGDERRIARFMHNGHTVVLADARGSETAWKPYLIAGAKGGVEVYRSEAMELRRGDRVRFTRNDPASGLTNGETAAVESIDRDGVRFRLDNGSVTKLGERDPRLRHTDRAFAATVHAFQGRTVGRMLAALDTTAKQAAWETVFGRNAGRERERDHVTGLPTGWVAVSNRIATGTCGSGAPDASVPGQDSGKPDREIDRAWSDEPWVIDGAAVRVSLVCFSRADDGHTPEIRLDGEPVDEIHSDLTAKRAGVGIDLTRAGRMSANIGVAFMDDTKGAPST